MILYKAIRTSDGVCTNQWYSDFAGPDYYEPNFGAASDYRVVATDLTGTKQDPPWRQLRGTRDQLLSACDWTQLSDVPDSATKSAWQTYRQALRDLPKNTTDPTNPAWPTPPTAS